MAKEINHIIYKEVKVKKLEVGMVLREWGEIANIVKCGGPVYPYGRRAFFIILKNEEVLYYKGKKELNKKIEVVERVEKKIEIELSGSRKSTKAPWPPKEYLLTANEIEITLSPKFINSKK